MAYIKVDTDALGDSVKKLSKLHERMDNVQQRLSTLSSQLDWEIKGREELENRLNQLKSQIGTIGTDIGNAANFLEQVSNEYIAAHNDAKKEAEGLASQITPGYSSSATAFSGTGTALGVSPQNCMYAGDPVNVATGSFYISAKDLEMPDLSEVFIIERKYASIHKRSGLLGPGWTMNLDNCLSLEEEKVTVLCPDGHTETFCKDEDSWKNTKGGSLSMLLSYDASKSQWLMSEPLKKKTYLYNEKGRLICITDKNNNTIEMEYQNGSLQKVKTFSCHILHITCANGRIAEIKDESGRKVQYQYTEGYLTTVIDPEGGTTRYAYESQGCICAVTDQNHNTYIQNKYDSEGRVVYQEYANGETCTISYDDENRQTVFEYNPEKRAQTYRYNEDYLVTQVVYEDESFEEYSYDEYQNKTIIRDRNGNTTRRQYDIYGNLLREELPNGLVTEFRYDNNLNLIERFDNNGGRGWYAYDRNSNLITHERKISEDSLQTIINDYDDYGRIIKTTDSMGNSRSFVYEDDEKLLHNPM